MAPQVIVFDFGNVVGYFSHRKATERLAPFADVSADRLHAMLFGSELEDRYERGVCSTEDFRATIRADAGLKCDDAFFDEAYGDIFWPNAELCERLPALARRFPLVLLSNTNELHARRFLEQLEGPLRCFRQRVLSHEARSRKPEPAIFAQAQALAGCAAEEILFFDDLPANVAGARQAGWNAVLYTGIESLDIPV